MPGSAKSSWLEACAAGLQVTVIDRRAEIYQSRPHVDTVIQGTLGISMPASEAIAAARQLLQAAADAYDMPLFLNVQPLPRFLRCQSSNPTVPKIDETAANVADVTSAGSGLPRSGEPLSQARDGLDKFGP